MIPYIIILKTNELHEVDTTKGTADTYDELCEEMNDYIYEFIDSVVINSQLELDLPDDIDTIYEIYWKEPYYTYCPYEIYYFSGGIWQRYDKKNKISKKLWTKYVENNKK